jgi:membrane protease YdiL (CAAX protease family)
MARIRELVVEQVRALFGRPSWLQILITSALAGFCEEVLFRGVVQGALESWIGPWGALLLAAALFGLAHPLSRLYVLLASLVGLWAGLLLLIFDDLTVPVVVHALHDLLAFAALRLAMNASAAPDVAP